MGLALNSKDRIFENMMATTTPCFFCLQDSRKYFKSEMIDCDPPHRTEPISAITVFCLRNLSHFLKLLDVNKETFTELRRKLSEFNQDAVVPVCEDCSEMTKDFSELYDLLPGTRRQLECCVQKIQDVIVKNVVKKTKAHNECRLFTDNNDDVKEDLTVIMKMDEITTQVNVSLPKVILPKANRRILDRECDHNEKADLLESTTLSSTMHDDKYGISPPSSQEGTRIPHSVNAIPIAIAAKPDRSIQPPQLKTKIAKSDSFLPSNCPYCRVQFQEQNSACGAWLLRQHLLQCHCEHYFPHEKLDTVSVPQYKKILAEVLFKDLTTKNGCCSFCNYEFRERGLIKIVMIKSHLVEYHYLKLKEKLMHIQKDPNLSLTLSKCNPHGMMCECCGVYLPDEDYQTNHQNLFCNGPYNRSKIRHHQPDHMSNFSPTPLSEGNVTCKLCNKIMKRSASLWHYTYSCRKGLLRSPPGKDFTALVNQGSPFSCNYCRKEFSGRKRVNLLIHHWIRFHPEHFFLDEMNNLKGLTKLQFQMILHNILFVEVQSGENNNLSCDLCFKKFDYDSIFKKKYLVRKHLLYKHHLILKKRLEIILDHPKLMEKLYKSSREISLSCTCGMYIPSCGKSIKRHHEMFQCNSVSPPCSNTKDPNLDLDLDVDEFTLDSDSEVEEDNGQDEKLIMIKKAKDPSCISCVYCRMKFRSKNVIKRNYLLTNHLVRFHPEHFFLDQTEQVTRNQLQRIMHHILLPEFIPKSMETCTVCPKRFTGYNASVVRVDCYFKRHLIEDHKEKLEERLGKILKMKKNVIKSLDRFPTKGMSCPCGMYIPVSSTFSKEYHENFQCNLSSSSEEKVEDEHDLDDKDEFLRDPNDNDVPANYIPIIAFPKKSSPNPIPIVKTKAKVSTNSASAPLKPQRAASPIVKMKTKKSTAPASQKNEKCYSNSCRAKFSTLSQLRHHKMRFHLERYFPKCKLDFISPIEFQKILVELLFRDLINPGSCPYCEKVFSLPIKTTANHNAVKHKMQTIKFHLMYYHRRELKLKLEDIQMDPNLHEILANANPSGRVCDICGIYLRSVEVQRMHDKLHCRRKAIPKSRQSVRKGKQMKRKVQ